MRHGQLSLLRIAVALLLCWLHPSYARLREDVVKEVLDSLTNGVEPAFIKWQAKYNITFVNGTDEYTFRLQNFQATLEFCQSFNENRTEVWMGLGPFSHMNVSEFKTYHHGYRMGPRKNNTTRHHHRKLAQAFTPCLAKQYNRVTPVPAAWSWTNQPGVLPPVQNQGSCGDCWAFSAAGAMSTLTAIVSGKPVNFVSAQAITSCTIGTTGCAPDTPSCPPEGCGGFPQEAFNYVSQNGGIASTTTYPFVGATGTAAYPNLDTPECNGALEKDVATSITGYCDVPAGDVQALQSAVAYQPVSVGVSASSAYWMNYAGGILTNAAECGTTLDHAVLVVGYNTTAPIPYWLLMNQWGAWWGEDGFVQVAMSTSAGPSGVCGVLEDPSIPTTTLADADQTKPPSPPAPPPSPGGASMTGGHVGIYSYAMAIIAMLMCMLCKGL